MTATIEESYSGSLELWIGDWWLRRDVDTHFDYSPPTRRQNSLDGQPRVHTLHHHHHHDGHSRPATHEQHPSLAHQLQRGTTTLFL